MLGEKDQLDVASKFEAHPKYLDKIQEIPKWKRFIAFFVPSIVKKVNKTIDIAENYYGGEGEKRIKEGNKFAEEAIHIAEKTKFLKQEQVKQVNDELERIFSNSDIPEEIKFLQFSILLDKNPYVKEQFGKIMEMKKVLGAVNFTSFNFKTKVEDKIAVKDSSVEELERKIIDDKKYNNEINHIRKKIEEYENKINQLENNLQFFTNVDENNPLLKVVHSDKKSHQESLKHWQNKLINIINK